MIGVEAVINGAQERIELVARVLAKPALRTCFQGCSTKFVKILINSAL